jgi:hypothetical protein
MASVNPSIHCQFHCIRHPSNLLLEKWAKDGMQDLPVDDFDFFL